MQDREQELKEPVINRHEHENSVIYRRVEQVLEQEFAKKLPPRLHLVATPIGNLSDITLRALAVMQKADILAAEDSRHSRKLLAHFAIERKLQTYHDHNGEVMGPRLLTALQAGQSVALISDAGMPLISDPGYKLAKLVIEAGLEVEVLPGANAALTGLCASGLPTDKFFFAGFLPPKKTARQKALQDLQSVPGTLIFYESAKRIKTVLEDSKEVFTGRELVIARELTKRHEEILRGSVGELSGQLEERQLKGELVLLVSGAGKDQALDNWQDDQVKTALLSRLSDGLSVRDSVKSVMEQSGLPKSKVYALALAVKEQLPDRE